MFRFRSVSLSLQLYSIQLYSIQLLWITAIIIPLTTGSLVAQEAKSKTYRPDVVSKAENILAEMELKRTGKSIQSTSNAVISRAISGLTRKKRELRLLQQEWKQAADNIAALRQELKRLNAQYGELNLKLSRVAGVDTAANNRIVGLINATVARRKALIDERDRLKEELAKRRAALNQAEADYADTVLAIRGDFDSVREKLESALRHDQAATAFRVLNANFATPAQPTSETILKSLDKRIERIEQAVFSESIKLDVERNSLYVNVVIGNKTSRMVVDSGASLISLPRQTADQLGIRVPSDAPKMRLVLADGREIPARGYDSKSTRWRVRGARRRSGGIGCFLGNFKFEIDAADKTLKLLRVESD